jgi:hypothetical protein
MGEWGARYRCKPLHSFAQLRDWAKPTAGDGRLAFYMPGMVEHFETWCRFAWIWIRARPGGVLVVEELAHVTTPGKAPRMWHEIISTGLRYGPRIYALTQRPAESDKTVMGNASVIHAHRVAFTRDRDYMAEALTVPRGQVAALRPLEFIERDMLADRVTRGRVSFGRAK